MNLLWENSNMNLKTYTYNSFVKPNELIALEDLNYNILSLYYKSKQLHLSIFEYAPISSIPKFLPIIYAHDRDHSYAKHTNFFYAISNNEANIINLYKDLLAFKLRILIDNNLMSDSDKYE